MQDILPGENHGFTQWFDHFVGVALGVEVATDQGRRKYAQAGFRIQAAAGVGHRRQIEVGGKNLDLGAVAPVAENFEEQNGDRISLFAGGAAGHPDADFLARRLVCQSFFERCLERFKSCRVAEECRDRDQDFLAQLVVFLGVFLGEVEVFVNVIDPVRCHSAQDTAPDGGFLVAGEINLGMTLHLVKQGLQRRWAGRRLFGMQDNGALAFDDHADFTRDLARRKHPVGAAGVDGRLRHAGVFGRERILGKHQAAARLDRPRPGGAIAARAGENNRDRVLAAGFRQRMKERIDRWFWQHLNARLDQLEALIVENEVAIRRRDVNVVGQRHAVVFNLADFEVGRTGEELHHHAAIVRREMLQHDKRHIQVSRQAGNEGGERLKAARRSPDGNDETTFVRRCQFGIFSQYFRLIGWRNRFVFFADAFGGGVFRCFFHP